MKSNTSYTPGPWEVHKSESGYTYVFGQEGGLPVCELKSREEANARLIAVVPDLLRMLTEEHEDVIDVGGEHDPNDCRVCELIAKAEGRS